MSYLPTHALSASPELDELERVLEPRLENQLERFVNLLASIVTVAAVAREGLRGLLSPVVVVSAAGALAVMYLPRRVR